MVTHVKIPLKIWSDTCFVLGMAKAGFAKSADGLERIERNWNELMSSAEYIEESDD